MLLLVEDERGVIEKYLDPRRVPSYVSVHKSLKGS